MRVLIQLDEHGQLDRVVTDDPCDVIVVCDSTPSDRIYKLGSIHAVGTNIVNKIITRLEARTTSATRR